MSKFIFAVVLIFVLCLIPFMYIIGEQKEKMSDLQADLTKMNTLVVLTDGDTLSVKDCAVLGANAAILLSNRKQKITAESLFETWLQLYHSRIQAKEYQSFKNKLVQPEKVIQDVADSTGGENGR